MVYAAKILGEAAREAVQDIDNRCEGYDVELVKSFTRVLQLLRDEQGDRAQRHAIETLIQGLASEVNARLECA